MAVICRSNWNLETCSQEAKIYTIQKGKNGKIQESGKPQKQTIYETRARSEKIYILEKEIYQKKIIFLRTIKIIVGKDKYSRQSSFPPYLHFRKPFITVYLTFFYAIGIFWKGQKIPYLIILRFIFLFGSRFESGCGSTRRNE